MSEENKDIAVIPEIGNGIIISPKQRIQQAQEVAEACKEIVMKKSVNIKGKNHVEVEGWQTIAIGHGCTLSARDVKKVDNGYSAIGEVKRISDGMVIATGEGFLGDDEETWEGRDDYAKRAMAQTRAMSRAGRSAFAYVVVLMGNDLSTTPAEEVPEGGFKNDRPNCPTCGVKLYKKKEDGSFFCWKNKEKKKNGCGAVFTADFQTKGKDTSEKVNKFNKFWEQISTKQRDHMASMTLEDKYTFFNEHKWDIEKVKEVLAEEMELDKVSKETVPDAVFGSDKDLPFK